MSLQSDQKRSHLRGRCPRSDDRDGKQQQEIGRKEKPREEFQQQGRQRQEEKEKEGEGTGKEGGREKYQENPQ